MAAVNGNGFNGANGARSLPIMHQFPCSKCLQHIVTEKLLENLNEKIAADETAAHILCFEIARQLRIFQGINVSAHRIKLKIMEMRKLYVSFRNFTKKPGVHFIKEHSCVEIDQTYVMYHIGVETMEEAIFREEGLAEYNYLHEIFRKKKFPLFSSEPASSHVDPLLYSDSDDE